MNQLIEQAMFTQLNYLIEMSKLKQIVTIEN